MRRLKAIYLIPVFVLLEIGMVLAAYFLMLVPQMDKVKKAQSDWKAARQALAEVEGGYEGHLKSQVDNSKKLLDEYYTFHQIQNRMPKVLNMKEVYAGKEREGLVAWYRIMGTGQLVHELNAWARGFHLEGTPEFQFSGTLPYEEGLPSINLVEVPFSGEQTIVGRGYADLINKVQRMTGYSYYPLIIEPAGGKITVVVKPDDPRYRPDKPILETKVVAKGYFFTRGWDPNGAEAKTKVTEAKQLLENPPRPKPSLEEPGEPPAVLWFFTLETE